MKEKILNSVYTKLCEAFKTKFLPLKVFEEEYSKSYDQILKTLLSLTEAYHELKNSNSKEVIKLSKEEYIIKKINYHTASSYSIDKLAELKSTSKWIYNKYADEYDRLLKEGYEVMLTLVEYTRMKTMYEISSDQPDLSIQKAFWEYYHTKYFHYIYCESPEELLNEFKAKYLSNTALQLLQKAEQYLADIYFSGVETYIVNVGKRSFEFGRAGWTTSYFTVLNNGKEYSFASSAKDENGINGEFVTLFIIQNKYFIKLNVTVGASEQTTYIIWKDFEKVSVKNESEVLIAKYHGNETVIFDTRNEAVSFQKMILDIKDGGRIGRFK